MPTMDATPALPVEQGSGLPPRWLGAVWLGAGITGAVVALLSGVLGWALIGNLAAGLDASLAAAGTVLATTTEAVEVIDGVLEDTAAALESMEATLAGGEEGMQEAAALTASLGTLLTEEVPTALEGVLASMPALVDTARVIDRTMRALSLVGVDYDPEVPLDQSLTGIEQTLEPLPEQLRAQQEALEGLSASMSTMAASLGDLSSQVSDLGDGLSEASGLIDEYRASVGEVSEVVEAARSSLATQLQWARALLVLLCVTAAVSLTAPALWGWQVWRRGQIDASA
jgi:methyl-accepting chemotaxis protein